MTALGPASIVERDVLEVLFLRAPDEVEKFGPLWTVLEELVGLRARKFYGAFYPEAHEYRVCTEIRAGDEAEALGLESGVLPGGRFLRCRLRGEAPAIYAYIAPTFTMLRTLAVVDPTRPGIEYYRSHGEIDCLLPIRGPG
jgi:hypothetical protein